MDLLLSADRTLSTAASQTALDLLDQHALVLKGYGELALARRVDLLVSGLRHTVRS
jgi:hypothetical protein